jgi:sporulation protein YlmC with PRC-barrel domain
MARKQFIQTDDGVRLAPLSELKDFQVADGHHDIRGWRVTGVDGRDVGKVHDLIVDLDGMRTRYVDVRLSSTVAASEGARDVLVPIGAVTLDDKDDVMLMPLSTDRISLLPAYNHRHLLRADESEIRRHFSLAEAATATAVAAGPATEREVANDRKIEARRVADIPDARQEDDTDFEETIARIPVADRDNVVIRRGDDGHDEIVIRRPRSE